MTIIATVPYLLRRGYRFSFRRVVPKQLTCRLGRREVKVALSTVDLSVARRRARMLANRFEEVLEMVAKNEKLSVVEIDDLLRKYLAAEWSAMEQDALDPDLEPEEEVGLAEEGLEIVTSQIRDSRFDGLTRWHAQKALGGRLPPEGSTEYRHALSGILRAQAELSRLRAAIFQGKHVPTLDPLFADVRPASAESAEGKTRAAASTTMTEALRGWAKAERRSTKTVHEWDTAASRFVGLHGDLPVDQVETRHIRDFRDAMAAFPRHRSKKLRKMNVRQVLKAVGRNPAVPRLTPATVNKQMTAVKSVLSWCVDSGYLERNPCDGIRVKGATKPVRPRIAYSFNELLALFSGPVHTAGERLKGGAGEASYWLPVLGLYTGARLEELGQLLACDVKEELGVTFLDINALGGKRVKTRGSWRRVPVHPELVRLGFLRHVEQRRKAGTDARLFPDLRADCHGTLTGPFSKWYNRYVRDVVAVPGELRLDFHSFRHTFKDACREAGVPEDIRDQLCGHSHPSVGRGYGSGHSLKTLAGWTAKIEYPGVKIERWKL